MTKEIYISGEYVEKNPKYHVEDSSWKAQQVLALIRRHQIPVKSVGEIGCGAGEILRQIQLHLPEDSRFYGYEISPHAFALCQQRANDRLQFFHADLLSVEVEPFDLLLCLDVLEHVEDYMGFLSKMCLKAAYKMFLIPLDLSVQMVLRVYPILKVREEVGHLHYFMKETALATLHDAGYQIIEWCYAPSGLDRPKSLKARMLKLPRKICSAINQDLTVRMLGGYSLLVLAK